MAKKWWIIIGIAVVLVGLAVALPLVFLLGGGPDTSTPQATVGSLFRAMERKDVDDTLACVYFTSDDERNNMHSGMESLFAAIHSIEFSNLTIEVTSQTDTIATVKASYHYRVAYNDGNVEEGDEPNDEYELMKVDGQWLITNLSS